MDNIDATYLLATLSRIADSLESIAEAVSELNDKGIDTYEQNLDQ
jgi:hypothetical protein